MSKMVVGCVGDMDLEESLKEKRIKDPKNNRKMKNVMSVRGNFVWNAEQGRD